MSTKGNAESPVVLMDTEERHEKKKKDLCKLQWKDSKYFWRELRNLQ